MSLPWKHLVDKLAANFLWTHHVGEPRHKADLSEWSHFVSISWHTWNDVTTLSTNNAFSWLQASTNAWQTHLRNFAISYFSSYYFYFSLKNPSKCPYNGARNDDCPLCHKELFPTSGGTYFSKVRFDVSRMSIIGKNWLYMYWMHNNNPTLRKVFWWKSILGFLSTSYVSNTTVKRTTRLCHSVFFYHVALEGGDFTFAVTRGRHSPNYGTAGDCYSRSKCPQVR